MSEGSRLGAVPGGDVGQGRGAGASKAEVRPLRFVEQVLVSARKQLIGPLQELESRSAAARRRGDQR